MEAIQSLVNVLVNFFAYGLLHATWWQMVLVTLVLTHITIAGVTIYLHRHQAHRALDMGPIPSHFFRFWPRFRHPRDRLGNSGSHVRLRSAFCRPVRQLDHHQCAQVRRCER